MSVRYRNFTLIEIVAVMMIFTLVIGIAVTAVRQIPDLAGIDQIIAELKQHCAEARRTASCQRRTVSVCYDPEQHSIISEEGEIPLPEDMNIRIGNKSIRDETEKYDIFVFFPDGSGQAQSIKIERGTDTSMVVLSPLTGRIFSKDGKED